MAALTAGAIDVLLALGLVLLAWRALASAEMFRAVVMFVAFGLVLALAWVRLDAPDIALAEAAIGAGLTGALLLAALAGLRAMEANEDAKEADNDPCAGSGRWSALVVTLLLGGGLGYAVLSLPHEAAGLGAEVSAHLEFSGVSNPVTAVLLNFRGYDTMLEMLVLLLAVLGVWSLGGAANGPSGTPGLVLDMLSRLLAPVMILIAAYLLWAGAHAPGGAFQAGAVLGAAGVLLVLGGWRLPRRFAAFPLRLALAAGPALFLALAVVTLALEGRLLQFPRSWAGLLILLVEAAATLSIGATLAALFLGGRPRKNKEDA